MLPRCEFNYALHLPRYFDDEKTGSTFYTPLQYRLIYFA